MSPGKLRIIPARAGFTPTEEHTMTAMTDHPRSRGVYVSWSWRCWGWRGSSPLARGLLQFAVVRDEDERIIPARAGFTRPGLTVRETAVDHPRSRGVYDPGDRPDPVRPGSSPLARGLPAWMMGIPPLLRIIPARAGFTGRLLQHARDAAGSSPLARGLPEELRGPVELPWIIPARAGFTCGF